MAGVTPNRGYPYSTPTDPDDVPAAIQALAEALDLDMQLLDDSIVPRPFASVSYSSPLGVYQNFPANTDTEAEFDSVDADNAFITDLSASPSHLTPTSPGLWLAWAAIAVPAGASTLGTSLRSLFIRVNGADVARNAFDTSDPNGTITGMTLATMSVMDGVDDYFTLTFNPVQALDDLKIRVLRLSCMRITNT